MNARRLLVVVCCLGVVAAGCGRSAPTEWEERARVDAAPRRENGVMHGSGNRGADSTSTQQSAPGDTEASGVLHGSGN